MTDWVVRRWARYGHERLYAATPGGTDLGYLDVKTGRWHCDELTNLPLLQRAVADYQGEQDGKASAPVDVSADAGVAPVSAEPPEAAQDEPVADTSVLVERDLALNVAGAEARARAIAEKQAAPVRTVLCRLLGVRTEERDWRIGADGEVAVAAQLAKLDSTWRVLHAVPVGQNGADIDHVVVGPGGVYVINAKHHPKTNVWVGGDTVMVNGVRVPHVRNSRYEARRAARMLTEHAGFPVAVGGIIAVMGAHRGFTIKEQPRDGAVVVVPRKQVSQYLRARPAALTPAEIETIYTVARRPTTWQ